MKQRFVSRFSLHNYIVRIINHYDVEDEQWAVRGLQVENIAFDYRSLLRSTAHRLRTRASYYVDAVSLDIYLDSSFLVGYNEIIAAARNVTRLKSCGIMRGIRNIAGAIEQLSMRRSSFFFLFFLFSMRDEHCAAINDGTSRMIRNNES